MSSFGLKLIAMVSMLVDHLGILLYARRRIGYDTYLLMRTLGRFAFPIYCFLLAEGFRHLRRDSRRLRDHVLLLLLLAAVSELLFDRLFDGSWIDPSYQNVIFTLLIAFCGLRLAEDFRDRPLPRIGVCLLCMAAAWHISSDYRAAGVLLVFLCDWYLNDPKERDFPLRTMGILGVMVLYYSFLIWAQSGFGGPAAFWRSLSGGWTYALPHLLLVPLLASYSGRLGPRVPVLHRCYQWYYPAHLALLCGLAVLLG